MQALAKQQLAAAKQQAADKANQVPPKLHIPFELVRRTRMCDDWVNSGRCKNGDDCVFAHDVQEKNANWYVDEGQAEGRRNIEVVPDMPLSIVHTAPMHSFPLIPAGRFASYYTD